jgi:hypothetical protein
MEFDYAVSQEKPILAFLIRDPSKLPFIKCEPEPQAGARLEQFREKAKKSRLVKHYDNPDGLKSQVLQSLNYQFKVNPKRGWVSAGQSKREDIEEIRNLLNRVMALENDIAKLRSLHDEVTARLGHGKDEVSWTINVTEVVFEERDRETNSVTKTPFPPSETELHTTWDDLLTALYYSGSSRLDSDEVAPRLFYLFVSKISDEELRHKLEAHCKAESENEGFGFVVLVEDEERRSSATIGLGFN